jgi:ankyrin repeat protein
LSEQTEALHSAFDGHHVDGIRLALEAGADACSPYRGKLPIYWLLEQYTRSDRLPQCLLLLIERGAVMDDPLVLPVLLDDADAIRSAYASNPSILEHRTSLVSSFTSLLDVPLLHVAAEYGNQNAARALIELGADVNARAGVDEDGLNGHTALFHTVNSNANRSAPIMKMLVEAGADCAIRLDGLAWGKGFEWETIFFDVTPISFAQFGLLPQVHRNESDVYSNIESLINASRRKMPELNNVPNKYLRPKLKEQG